MKKKDFLTDEERIIKQENRYKRKHGLYVENNNKDNMMKIGLYINKEDYEVIKKLANKMGLRYSAYMRMVLLQNIKDEEEKL